MAHFREDKELTIRYSDLDQEEYADIIETLRQHGITLSSASVHIDVARLWHGNKKGAGRPEKIMKWPGEPTREIRLDEIKRLQRTMNMSEIAALFGVSRRTLYRRINEAKMLGSESII